MMLFDPRWVRASKEGIMYQGGGPERSKHVCVMIRQQGGGDGTEIKLTESKCEESHTALGVK
jgi:hypothetical protein